MMITFQRQIESVGSHQALISRPADGVQRRCSCIRFHRRRRLRVEADRGQVTNRQTLRAEATLSALCIQKQWDPRRLRGPRQTSWNYSFPPTGSDCTAHTAGLRLLTAQTVCYHDYIFSSPANKGLKESRGEVLVRVLLEWAVSDGENWPQNARVNLRKNIHTEFACFCTGWQTAEEWFHLKSNEECSSTGLQSALNGKTATFMWALWDGIITHRWQGCSALYSGFKDHSEYWGQGCHHKSQRLRLWFQIWHYIYITDSRRLSM